LSELGSEGMIRLAGSYTLARMLEREDFRTRLRNNQPISIHELLYPLAQAYDSIVLKADAELGGHDQLLNLLVGRHMMKDRGMTPQVVLTVPLLIGTDGKEKMSKSLGNAIAVEDSAQEIYGRTMSIPDELMWDWYLLLTDLAEEEIDKRRTDVESGELHPKKLKMDLARRLVADFHSDAAAQTAEDEFESVFRQGGVPEEIPLVELSGSANIVALVASAKLASSKSEARRLVQQGAVSVDGDKIGNLGLDLESRDEPYLLKVGKRRFARVQITR